MKNLLFSYNSLNDNKGDLFPSNDPILPNIDPDPYTNTLISSPLQSAEYDLGGDLEQSINDLYNDSIDDYFPEDVIPLDTDSDIPLNQNDGDIQCPDNCNLYYSDIKQEWGCLCEDDIDYSVYPPVINSISSPNSKVQSSFNLLYLLPLLLLIK